MEVNFAWVKDVLDPEIAPSARAGALAIAFSWTRHSTKGVRWPDQHDRLLAGRDLSPEAREYLERLLQSEPRIQSFWVNVYLHNGAYTCGGTIRNSREEAEEARRDLGRQYVGPIEIKLPALPPGDQPTTEKDVA